MDRTGNLNELNPILLSHNGKRPLHFDEQSFSSLGQWKALGQGAVMEHLRYSPAYTPLDAQTDEVVACDGYRRESISFISGGCKVPGYLLIPDGQGPFPAVVGLHDHGGFYYWGKEKIVDTGIVSDELTKFVKRGFDGVFWASELVKKGYVVLVIDAFYFGERRLRLEDVPPYVWEHIGRSVDELKALEEGSEEYIAHYNELTLRFEVAVEQSFRFAGIEWPGVLAYDDRTSVDYLCSRPEVDKDRIGCCGLSLGGFRSAMLTAMDPRIKCSIVAGWMVSYNSLFAKHCHVHTHMVSIHGLPNVMDLPDMLALACPTPLMLMQCTQDQLYTVEGMQEACDQIGRVYRWADAEDRYRYGYYDHRHQFCKAMQADATDWLNHWLKP